MKQPTLFDEREGWREECFAFIYMTPKGMACHHCVCSLERWQRLAPENARQRIRLARWPRGGFGPLCECMRHYQPPADF